MGMDINAVTGVVNTQKFGSDNNVSTSNSTLDGRVIQSDTQVDSREEVNSLETYQSTPESRQQKILKSVNTLNHLSKEASLSVHFEYNQDADRVVMKFIDPNNNQMVKQIPSETVINTDIQIRKFIGVLFDKMV